MSDAYYMNSLRSWKADLQKDLRRMMARHAKLEGQFHPSRPALGKLIDLNHAYPVFTHRS